MQGSRPCRMLHCLRLLVVAAAVVRGRAAESGPPGPGPFSSAGAAAAAEEEAATAAAAPAAALLGSSTARLRAAQAKEEEPFPSSPSQQPQAPTRPRRPPPAPPRPPRPTKPTTRLPSSEGENDDIEDEDGEIDDGLPSLHLNKKLLPVAAAEVTALGSALFPQLLDSSPLGLQPLLETPLLDLREDNEWSNDEIDEDDYVRASLALALARTVGRLGELDVAKELYISLRAREHAFPFCAWQVIFDPHVFTPVLLDTNSVYRMQALHFRTRSDVFRITGRFPRVRYFSFQSYDSAGQPLTSLPDFLVRERQCGSNPFTNPYLSPPAHESESESEVGTYEIYVTADGQHGYPNELAALRDPSLVVSTTTILYRLYGRDPSVGEARDDDGGSERLWGFVDPPIVERRVMGKEAWERLPPCAPSDLERVAHGFVAAEQKYFFPLPPQDDVCGLYDKAGRSGVVDRMYPYGHLETRGVSNYVVYTNKDSNYLYWCDSVNRLGRDFLLVLRGQLPLTPAGLYTEPRIARAQSYDARYVSISTVENMAPSDTYVSVDDAQLEAHYARLHDGGVGGDSSAWDRRYTVVAAVNETLLEQCNAQGGLRNLLGKNASYSSPGYFFLPFARPGLTAPRLPGLVYREILARYRVNGEPDASAAYLKSVCDGGNADCHEAATLASLSERIMGPAYPCIEVYACDWAAGRWRRLN